MSVKKALVVDDSKLARITLKKKLELRAVDVDMVESASEALSYLQSHQPDIIFMDHLMPDIDGFEATKRIKSNPATRHIPVIMCTGKEHEGYLQEATAIGATNILAKPPETEALDAILTMDLEPAAVAVADAPAFIEPPVLTPIATPATADAELIDDSFDADAAFGVETEVAAVADATDFIDTSELESLASLDMAPADDMSSNDNSMLLDDVESIGELDNEPTLASLNDILGDDRLTDEESLVADVVADASPLGVDDRALTETAFAEPIFVESKIIEPAIIEPPAIAASSIPQQLVAEPRVAAAGASKEELLAFVHALFNTEFASRTISLRETIIADLTQTIRRQMEDTRNVAGENAEQHDSRLRALKDDVADLVANAAQKTWVLEKLPPALDMARLTDDIAARIAVVQGPNVMPSDDLVSARARLDEVESELAALRNREVAAPPPVDGNALQSLLPTLSRQLDALLLQRIPVIVSDISDQVQLQLAYQMNDGRAPEPSTPSLDSIITHQADIETQIAALKKQLTDEWNTRLQALTKQQFASAAPVDTHLLREQVRNDVREDLRRAVSELQSPAGGTHSGSDGSTEVPVANAGHFEQMLETVTNQFARTQAEYEQKLKQSRLIAIGAVVASVVVSVAMKILF